MASSLLGLYSKPRESVTTEWDDIQRRIGNLPPLPSSDVEEATQPAHTGEAGASAPPAAAAEGTADAGGTTDPADADADADDVADGHGSDDDDTAILRELRATRLRELQGRRFGKIIEIDRAAFVEQVNHAGDGIGVVVFLFKSRHYHSSLMLVLLEKLAHKFQHLKFVQIDYDDCIPGYPERNLPTLLLYRDDDLLGQCVGAAAFGGSSFGIDDVEWELAQKGLVTTELQRNPHEQPH